jgi:hypothetical protein
MRTGPIIGLSVLTLLTGFAAGVAVAPAMQSSPAAGRAVVGEAPGGAAAAGSIATERAEARPDGQGGRRALAASRLGKVPQLRPAAKVEEARADRRRMTAEELPPAVLAVFRRITLGREVKKLTIERRQRNGQPIYNTEFYLDSVEHEYEMDEAGKLLQWEWDIPLQELPAPVTKGIQDALPGAVLIQAEREQHEGQPLFFEVNLQLDGHHHEVQVLEDGKIIRHRTR